MGRSSFRPTRSSRRFAILIAIGAALCVMGLFGFSPATVFLGVAAFVVLIYMEILNSEPDYRYPTNSKAGKHDDV